MTNLDGFNIGIAFNPNHIAKAIQELTNINKLIDQIKKNAQQINLNLRPTDKTPTEKTGKIKRDGNIIPFPAANVVPFVSQKAQAKLIKQEKITADQRKALVEKEKKTIDSYYKFYNKQIRTLTHFKKASFRKYTEANYQTITALNLSSSAKSLKSIDKTTKEIKQDIKKIKTQNKENISSRGGIGGGYGRYMGGYRGGGIGAGLLSSALTIAVGTGAARTGFKALMVSSAREESENRLKQALPTIDMPYILKDINEISKRGFARKNVTADLSHIVDTMKSIFTPREGYNDQQVFGFAKQMYKTVIDMASAKNVPFSSATKAMVNFLLGDVERLKDTLGIAILDEHVRARMKEDLWKKFSHIYKNKSNRQLSSDAEAMMRSMPMKAIYRWNMIQEVNRSQGTIGDYERTKMLWANQIRILQENFTELLDQIGVHLNKYFLPILHQFNFLMERNSETMKTFIEHFKTFFDYLIETIKYVIELSKDLWESIVELAGYFNITLNIKTMLKRLAEGIVIFVGLLAVFAASKALIVLRPLTYGLKLLGKVLVTKKPAFTNLKQYSKSIFNFADSLLLLWPALALIRKIKGWIILGLLAKALSFLGNSIKILIKSLKSLKGGVILAVITGVVYLLDYLFDLSDKINKLFGFSNKASEGLDKFNNSLQQNIKISNQNKNTWEAFEKNTRTNIQETGIKGKRNLTHKEINKLNPLQKIVYYIGTTGAGNYGRGIYRIDSGGGFVVDPVSKESMSEEQNRQYRSQMGGRIIAETGRNRKIIDEQFEEQPMSVMEYLRIYDKLYGTSDNLVKEFYKNIKKSVVSLTRINEISDILKELGIVYERTKTKKGSLISWINGFIKSPLRGGQVKIEGEKYDFFDDKKLINFLYVYKHKLDQGMEITDIENRLYNILLHYGYSVKRSKFYKIKENVGLDKILSILLRRVGEEKAKSIFDLLKGSDIDAKEILLNLFDLFRVLYQDLVEEEKKDVQKTDENVFSEDISKKLDLESPEKKGKFLSIRINNNIQLQEEDNIYKQIYSHRGNAILGSTAGSEAAVKNFESRTKVWKIFD